MSPTEVLKELNKVSQDYSFNDSSIAEKTDDEYVKKAFMQSQVWQEHQRKCDQANLMLVEQQDGLSQSIEMLHQEEIQEDNISIAQSAPVDFSYGGSSEIIMGCACGMEFQRDASGNVMPSTDFKSELASYSIGDDGSSASFSYGTSKNSDAPMQLYKQ